MLKKLTPAIILTALLFSCGEDTSGPSGALSVTVTAPPASGAYATDTYTVTWTGEGTGNVSLYYNTVESPIGQQFIASGLSVSGSHQWDLSQVPSGTYLVRAIMTSGMETASSWSQGALEVDHSGGEPSLAITAPPPEGATANETYTLRWVSSGFSQGLVSLWYDTDTLPGGEMQIALDQPDNGEFLWNCASVPDGTYRIKGMIADEDDTVTVYSQGALLVNHVPDPWIVVEKPSAAGDSADNTYTIEWSSNAPSGATVTLWYDTDTDPSGGLQSIASGAFNDGYFTWDCSGTPEGEYYIYAQLIAPADGGRALTAMLSRISPLGRTVLADSYSQGTLTISHEFPWYITITAPPEEGAQADDSYLVEWISDAPPNTTMDLFYAVDTTGTALYPVAMNVSNSGSHLWNTEMVPEGNWYIYAAFTERGQGSDWSAGRVTIMHENEYSFAFTAPPPEGDTADEEYMLQWSTDAPDSAWVYLFYSTSNQPGGTMYTIVQGTGNSGQFNWNCSGVPEGDYWIYGFVSDERMRDPDIWRGSGSAWSQGMLSVSHSGYSMEVTAPPAAGATADSIYTIQWSAAGGPESVVALYYDNDTNPGNGMTKIADYLSNTGSYDWNTAAVPQGDWYVYAAIYDPEIGADGFAGDYSAGVLTIEHEYNYIILLTPPYWGAYAEDEYQINWAADTPHGGTVSLYYDEDTDPNNGMTFITEGLPWDDFGYLWNCSAVPEGEYYLYAKLENSQQTLTSYSEGILTIQRNPLILVFDAPPPSGATADDSYTLGWYSLGASERTIDLFYDDDTNPGNGMVLIAEEVPSSQYLSTYDWNCSVVPEGSYYIYGILYGDEWTYEKYSEGMLTIDH